MMESLRKQTARILREKKKYKLWLTAFLCMAVLVTAGTVAALTMSGQALNRKEKVLICGLEVHRHSEQCRDGQGELICKEADYVVHIHNDDCCGEDGELICQLAEVEPHVHDAACFTEEKNLVCALEESPGHRHDESCSAKERGELICGMEEESHQHGEECYAKVQGELNCASEEEGHEHTDECYNWSQELICELPQESHEHTDECYAWDEELICGLEEGEDAHIHTDKCYKMETVNLCGALEMHAHTDSCYDEEAKLICGETQLLEHMHTDECFEVIEPGAAGESGESAESEAESGGDEEEQLFCKTYEDAEIRAAAEYGKSANIPQGAQLVAERVEAGAEGDVQDARTEADPNGETVGAASAAQDSEAGAETVTEEISYRLRFLADGEEIRPEGRVTFTVQGLDENGSDAGEAVTLVYNAEDDADAMVVTLVRETEAEAQQEFCKEASDGKVCVTAEYDAAAGIPEEAELRVREITAESDAESYAQREAEYLEETKENAVMDVLFEMGFYVGETKIEPKTPVSVAVRIPESFAEDEEIYVVKFAEDGAEELDVCISAEEAGNRTAEFREDSPSVYAVGKPAPKTFQVRKECRIDALNIIVIAEYDLEAEIPEEAELRAEPITPENSPAYYAQCEAEYLEQTGEGARMDMLLNIGFYDADGSEIEPKAPVAITIQMLDDQYEEGEQMTVVHFGEDAAEVLDASEIRTDEEGNKATSFESSRFSPYAVGKSGGISLVSGSSYQIYCESAGRTYALYHNGTNGVEAIAVTIDAEGNLVVPNGYAQAGFMWDYEKGQDGAALKYTDTGGTTYYLWDDPYNTKAWSMTGALPITTLRLEGDSNDAIRIYGLQGSSLDCSNGQIVAGNTEGATAWKFRKPVSGTYRVNYYKNERGVQENYFQTEPATDAGKGTFLGSMELTPEETPDGKKVIRIPLTGTVGNNDVGALADYVYGGNTYKFYGWSLKGNSNYQPDIGHLIYCGTPVEINGHIVPTYVPEGVIVLDVANLEEVIDLYAIWAAPSNVDGSKGVEYYGTNYNKLSDHTDEERIGRGVMFFVRLDGQIPNEPGSDEDTSAGGILNRANYTEYVFAKKENGEEERKPLKYWMHIYGVQNGDAVEANLAYKPSDLELLNRIKEKDGIKVAGEFVDFSRMSVEEFQKNYYVSWYVCKDGRENDCWHVDGVLLKRTERWNLVYADNGITSGTVIPGAQYAFRGESEPATIHNTLVPSGDGFLQSDIPPEKTGYTFIGWNTDPSGNGTSFTAGTTDSDTDNDTITVEIIDKGGENERGQVYKNGAAVEGLFATKKANGVYEVVLYPQWAKGTNLLTVTKTDTEGIPLKGARFALYECILSESGELVRDKELTGSGSATSENGVLTIHNLENDTYYCLEESYAPNGYEQRNEIYFMVEVSEDESKVMDINIKDKHGRPFSTPAWVTTEYQPKDATGSGGLARINFTIRDEAILQSVSFQKTDESGKPLKGAQFKLSKQDKSGSFSEIGTSTLSGEDGTFVFADLPQLSYGKYKLEETTSPAGYRSTTVFFEINDPVGSGGYSKGMVVTRVEVDGEEVAFTEEEYPVDATETKTSAQANGQNVPATRYSYVLHVQNKKAPQKVALLKKGDDGAEGLAGAAFSLYSGPEQKDEDRIIANLVSDQEGKAVIGELECGEYYLFEDRQPDGYIRMTEPIKITVSPTGVTAQKGAGEGAAPVQVMDPDSQGTAYVVVVFNSKGITLPETGGAGTVMYTLGGLAAIAVSLMYGLGMRRSKGKGGQHRF